MNNQEYQGKMEYQLKELGEKIDELTNKAENAAEDVKRGYRENIDLLRSQKNVIQDKLQELKNSSGETWDEIKDGLDRTWDETKGIMKNAVSKLK